MAFPGCGVDLCAFVSQGTYSEYYGSADLQNLCNLFAFYGFLEDAPGAVVVVPPKMDYYRRLRD